MNNFHRFQIFRQFSSLLNFVFANLIEKATHVTLFWNSSRNPDKISSRIRREMQNSMQKMKKRKFIFHSRKNVDDFWLKFWDLSGAKVCKSCRVWKCCQTHIFLQHFVLIQPRTSPPKNCKLLQTHANFANLIPTTLVERVQVSRFRRPRATGPGKAGVGFGRRRRQLHRHDIGLISYVLRLGPTDPEGRE